MKYEMKYEIEGRIGITIGCLPYPRPIFITRKGKQVNLADELLGWDGMQVEIIIKEKERGRG